MPISFTKSNLPFGWLGNMSPYPIEFNGKTWRTAEALFQSMRFSDTDIIVAIWREKSPMGAKIVAKKNADKMTIQPLSEQDLANMLNILRLKIEQHSQLKEELLKTGNEIIIEDVTSRANPKTNNMIWGMAQLPDGSWVGKNVLGNLWMKVRNELQNKIG